MRKILAIIFLLFQFSLQAQIQEPVKWFFSEKKLSKSELELRFVAKIDKGWHLYNINLADDSPVLPTQFTFDNVQGAELVGGVSTKFLAIESFDKNFEQILSFFADSVVFTQKIKTSGKYSIDGNVRFMACNDENCLAPTIKNFSFKSVGEPQKPKAEPLPVLAVQVKDAVKTTADTLPTFHSEIPDTWKSCGDVSSFGSHTEIIEETAYGRIFFDGFLAGLLALFTPCVWPIIPLTVSFFLKRKKGKRDALLYGLSIVCIYTFVGMLITYIFGASQLNALSTSAVFNIFCFLLLVVFAASFLGMFEITLPSSWSTKLDAKAEKVGGLFGIFLMAATLSLVSFSCTGPIVGTLLVAESVDGAFLAPFVGMLAFSIALAVPFTVFALFPSWMNSLPKSGDWLNVVKVTLGFFELAFSLKFLSVADLAYGWRLLDREVFLSLWIVLSAMLGLYYLGKIRFAHEGEVKNVSFPRFLLALVCFAFSVYMIPGLWGAPLKAVSAFAPPIYTQDFNLSHKERVAFKDFDEGMAYAKQNNKLVLLDFTGYGCVNCRKMESTILADEEVKNFIDNNFVQITLFVDDKTPLENAMSVEENGEKLMLKTVGEKWSYLQRHKFSANAQPYYVILNGDGEMQNSSFSFTENVNDFLCWLKQTNN